MCGLLIITNLPVQLVGRDVLNHFHAHLLLVNYGLAVVLHRSAVQAGCHNEFGLLG